MNMHEEDGQAECFCEVGSIRKCELQNMDKVIMGLSQFITTYQLGNCRVEESWLDSVMNFVV